ncbi:MAG: hypothetical protein K2H19_02430 [Ruminococcus sp.]|nr:hypothetical protein [Ruminococcus sp.]
MKLKNIIAVILALILISIPVNAFASEYDTASGLIEKCSISCSGSDGTLKINAKTQASDFMDEIGFKNITIQKSKDLKKWTDIINLGDYIESGRKYYTLSYSKEVEGNCYYRVTCTHYAKGIPFMKADSEIQTAENLSKAVWIDNSHLVTDKPTPIIITTTSTNTTTIKETTTTAVTTTSAQTTVSQINSLKTSVLSRTVPNTVTSKISTETTVRTSSHINKKSAYASPSTGVNTPATAFFSAVISILIAVKSRKKSK